MKWILAVLVLAPAPAQTAALAWTMSSTGGTALGGVAEHGMAFDGVSGTTMLVGGEITGGATPGRSFSWDGAAWTECSVGAPVTCKQHAVATGVAQRILTNGGVCGSSPEVGGWQLVGGGACGTWLPTGPGFHPPPRFRHAMVRDASRNRIVLFGGHWPNTPQQYFNDTWEFVDNVGWVPRATAVAPPARRDHRMAYDHARNVVVLYGGRDASNTYLDDTWEWNGQTWTQKPTSGGPGPRIAHAMAMGPNGRVVLFGGRNDSGGSENDTWEWDGFNWIELTFAVPPGPRQDHAMSWNPDLARIVLHGGGGPMLYDDTWELRLLDGPGQGNSAQASLLLNNVGGGDVQGPFSVVAPAGGVFNFSWTGPPGSTILVVAGPANPGGATFTCAAHGVSGSLDIGFPPAYAGLLVVFNGAIPTFPNNLFVIGPSGTANQTFSVPTSLGSGPLTNLQSAIIPPPTAPPPLCVILSPAFFIDIF